MFNFFESVGLCTFGHFIDFQENENIKKNIFIFIFCFSLQNAITVVTIIITVTVVRMETKKIQRKFAIAVKDNVYVIIVLYSAIRFVSHVNSDN